MIRPLLAALLLAAPCPGAAPAPAPEGPSPEERGRLESGLRDLRERCSRLGGMDADLRADVEIYVKGAAWALLYEDRPSAEDLGLIQRAIETGLRRAAELADGHPGWIAPAGRSARGYRSEIDGSFQPYGLIFPAGLDAARPMRLDVVLHGSSRPAGLSELRFMSRFEAGAGEARNPAAQPPALELHPLGRVENGYRWAGEADVFEAIEAVCRRFPIDRNRIVLRGMSMGASGTWHLGLKHPDRFAALGPYCGYVDTHRFSETPMPNFIRVGPLPDHQERMLHMLDSVDYAANAGVVPAIACMGENDPFFLAHVLLGEAMKREGLQLVNLIAPGTGHSIDPATQAEQLRRIGEIAARGRDAAPQRLRFVTWTLKYSRCFWIQALGLGEHYRRAEIDARAGEGGSVDVLEPVNIRAFAILPPMLQESGARLKVGGREVRLPPRLPGEPERRIAVGRRGDGWEEVDGASLRGKRPGMQGPIDDAFTAPFLCVRGTGAAWNPRVQAWSEATLRRFAYEWSRYFRGDLPIKDDTQVTEDDLRRSSLILFGDPGSNRWISLALADLPLRWTRDRLQMGPVSAAAADHAPALIYPSPFPGAAGRAVVLNSGHTFHEGELSTLNYLLFPRLGDWAVFKVGGSMPAEPRLPLQEETIATGFFDEEWKLAGTPK